MSKSCASEITSVHVVNPGSIGADVMKQYTALSKTLRVNNATGGNMPSWIQSADVFTKIKIIQACDGNSYPQFIIQTLLDYLQPVQSKDRYKHKYDLYKNETSGDTMNVNRQSICQKLTEYCSDVNCIIETIEATYCKPMQGKPYPSISELIFPQHCFEATETYLKLEDGDSQTRMKLSEFVNKYLGPFVVVQMWTKFLQGPDVSVTSCQTGDNRRTDVLFPMYFYHISKIHSED